MHPTIEVDAPPRPAEQAPLPPNHHLWRNGHRWWIAIVLVDSRGRRRRLRRSLETRRLDRARLRRHALLARLARSRHWRPSSGLLEIGSDPSPADRSGSEDPPASRVAGA